MIRGKIIVLAVIGIASVTNAQNPVGDALTRAQAADGSYISWREHLIDDPIESGIPFSGSDGLVVGDIDNDGFEDIVSVHESDSTYDSATFDDGFDPPAAGHVRIAFGTRDPGKWINITLAEGAEVGAPEDAVLVDINRDGYLDIFVAAELAHLIYLENPGVNVRSSAWERLILPQSLNRGSYIRVFSADFNSDGIPEIIAPNKGAQRPSPADYAHSTPVELFALYGDPLDGDSWQREILGRYSIPQNSETVDLDGDGDQDIVVGARGENRILWFENTGELEFVEHAIGINGGTMQGFNLEYADLSGDGRLDIIGAGRPPGLMWIEQPAALGDAWNGFQIGTFLPDSVTGMELADIDGDGDADVIAGSYSRGDRMGDDSTMDIGSALGRIGWFENPGDAKTEWMRHDISRRKRGMFDKFIARDLDNDGDMDFIGTRGNSYPYDGVFWLEQVRTVAPVASFERARDIESGEMPLP